MGADGKNFAVKLKRRKWAMRKIAVWGMALLLVVCFAGLAAAAPVTLDGKAFSGDLKILVRNPMVGATIGSPPSGYPTSLSPPWEGFGIQADTPLNTDTVTDITAATGLIYVINLRLHNTESYDPAVSGFTGRYFKGYVDLKVTKAIDPYWGYVTDYPFDASWLDVDDIPVVGIQTGLGPLPSAPPAVAWSFATPNIPKPTALLNPTGGVGINNYNNTSILGIFQARTVAMASTFTYKAGTTIPILQSTATIAGFATGPVRLTKE
jgi:hypothetical protein